jgi:hypothetical protein
LTKTGQPTCPEARDRVYAPHKQGGALFDAKIAFKSQASIRQVEQQTLSVTKALARRIEDFLFSVAPAP